VRVLEAFETSAKLADEGRLCEIEWGGKVICSVRVRPADALLNSEYRRCIAEMSLEVKKGFSNGSGDTALSIAEDTDLLFTLYARSVIVSWQWADPEDRKATSLRFNEKNAVALFKKAPKFFEAIQAAAREWSHYRAAHEQDITKN